MSGSDKTAMAKVAEQASEGISASHTPPGAGDDAAAGDLFGFELAQFEGGSIRPPAKGPGRPPGSPNRSTLQLQRLLMARGYRDPAEFLAATMTMDVGELASALSCKKVEAMAHQLRAASELMPYFHQKMPVAVEVSNPNMRPVIIINDSNVAIGVVPAGSTGTMSVHDLEAQQYQQLSGVEPNGSHDDGSHDGS